MANYTANSGSFKPKLPGQLKAKVGSRFGALTIISYLPDLQIGGRLRKVVKVHCDCGHEKSLRVDCLTNKRKPSRSCGCKWRQLQQQAHLEHGHTWRKGTTSGSTPEYRSWQGALRRCYTPDEQHYPNYGGRGITVCERWKGSFEAFLADMGYKPSMDHSIERIDVNGHYEPGNCRWATKREQRGNRRCTLRIEWAGTLRPLSEVAQEQGIPYYLAFGRFKRGWPVARIFSQLVRL